MRYSHLATGNVIERSDLKGKLAAASQACQNSPGPGSERVSYRGPSRPRALLVALNITFMAAAAAPSAGQTAVTEGTVYDTVLSNGLAVIAMRNPIIPVATIELAFRNGSFTQVDQWDDGLPHLVEHMFFKSFGGGRWGTRAGDLDATYNGATGVETVTYYLIAPARHVEKGLDLMADQVRSPRFPDDELDEEKQRVINELERNAADPFFLLDFHTDLILWGPAFRQKNVGGSIPSIRAASDDALKEHYRRYYVPNNAALVVTGDVWPSEVFEIAAKQFDSWDRAADPFEGYAHPAIPPLARDTFYVVEAQAPDVTFTVAWHGPSESEDLEGADAADLFSEIVNQRVSGAQHRLVDSGLFHFLSLSYTSSNHVGAIKLRARTGTDSVVRAAMALRNEIALMGTADYFTGEELEMARTSTRVQAAFARESAISIAHELANEWSLNGLQHVGEKRMRVSEQSAEAVRRYVAGYIAGRPKALIMMVSSGTIDEHEGDLIASLNAWLGR